MEIRERRPDLRGVAFIPRALVGHLVREDEMLQEGDGKRRIQHVAMTEALCADIFPELASTTIATFSAGTRSIRAELPSP